MFLTDVLGNPHSIAVYRLDYLLSGFQSSILFVNRRAAFVRFVRIVFPSHVLTSQRRIIIHQNNVQVELCNTLGELTAKRFKKNNRGSSVCLESKYFFRLK